MKKINGIGKVKVTLGLFVMGFCSVSVGAEYNCRSVGFRGSVAATRADSHLVLNYDSEESELKVTGHVKVGTGRDLADAYYSVFSDVKTEYNLTYKPRVYLQHHSFDKLNASSSNSVDGGGMWGNLVVNKKADDSKTAGTFDAHYIFKAGDHLGGTVDYLCN